MATKSRQLQFNRARVQKNQFVK